MSLYRAIVLLAFFLISLIQAKHLGGNNSNGSSGHESERIILRRKANKVELSTPKASSFIVTVCFLTPFMFAFVMYIICKIKKGRDDKKYKQLRQKMLNKHEDDWEYDMQ